MINEKLHSYNFTAITYTSMNLSEMGHALLVTVMVDALVKFLMTISN